MISSACQDESVTRRQREIEFVRSYIIPVIISHLKHRSRIGNLFEYLKEHSSATFEGMANHFKVSEMTIRRDLRILAATGQVLLVPRGAQIAKNFLAEKPFLERIQRMAKAKEAIGKTAATLVTEGSSLVLDSGTTTLQVARHLREKRCMVITFSVAALQELADSPNAQIELIGGVYRSSSQDLVGAKVYEGLSAIRADRVIFGAAAVSLDGDVMVNDHEAARALLQSGRQRILVVDSSKIGLEALYRFCELGQCDLLITDAGAREADLEQLRSYVELLVAR